MRFGSVTAVALGLLANTVCAQDNSTDFLDQLNSQAIDALNTTAATKRSSCNLFNAAIRRDW